MEKKKTPQKTLGMLFCWGEARFCCCGNTSTESRVNHTRLPPFPGLRDLFFLK